MLQIRERCSEDEWKIKTTYIKIFNEEHCLKYLSIKKEILQLWNWQNDDSIFSHSKWFANSKQVVLKVFFNQKAVIWSRRSWTLETQFLSPHLRWIQHPFERSIALHFYDDLKQSRYNFFNLTWWLFDQTAPVSQLPCRFCFLKGPKFFFCSGALLLKKILIFASNHNTSLS